MNVGRLRIEFKRENINFGIGRSGILLVNKKSKLEPCLAKNLTLKKPKVLQNKMLRTDRIWWFYKVLKTGFLGLRFV